MAPPVSFDPSGRCVILTGDRDAHLFHAEILKGASKYMSERLIDSNFYSFEGRRDTNERPIEIGTYLSSKGLRMLKRWAYYGDLEISGRVTLQDIQQALGGNERSLKIAGFQDALVDKVIQITTAHYLDIQDFKKGLIAYERQWPAGFRTFFIDWMVYGNKPDAAQKAIIDAFKDGTLSSQLEHEFVARAFASRPGFMWSILEPPWRVDACKYHSHAAGGDCYKVAGAINVLRRQTPSPGAGEDTEADEDLYD